MKKLFDGKTVHLCIDQHGGRVYARTLKELRLECIGAVTKCYVDRGGKTYWTGYVIGDLWFSIYAPCEVEV